MFESYIKIAESKAATDKEAALLREICAVASELDEQERSFEERINQSKAARGEGPTKLSKAKRKEVDQYAADAAEMANEQLTEFQSLDGAWTIIYALHAGLASDVRFWSKVHLKGHPAEAPIVQEFAAAKAKLRDALAGYLKAFPGDED
jgi:hypothetical protein